MPSLSISCMLLIYMILSGMVIPVASFESTLSFGLGSRKGREERLKEGGFSCRLAESFVAFLPLGM